MTRFAPTRTCMLSPLAVALLVLVLLNPFCCHLLPYYEVALVPEGSVLAEYEGVCAGKPEALSDRAVDIVPVLLVVVITFGAAVMTTSRRVMHLRRAGRVCYAGPPRHKVFSVFLL